MNWAQQRRTGTITYETQSRNQNQNHWQSPLSTPTLDEKDVIRPEKDQSRKERLDGLSKPSDLKDSSDEASRLVSIQFLTAYDSGIEFFISKLAFEKIVRAEESAFVRGQHIPWTNEDTTLSKSLRMQVRARIRIQEERKFRVENIKKESGVDESSEDDSDDEIL